MPGPPRFGKPAEATDPDRADIEEAKMHLEGSTKPADVEAFLKSMPPNFVNVMADEVRPIVLQKNYEEAERRGAEQAADRARREAEMTAEEDEWEAAERAKAAEMSRQQTVAPRDETFVPRAEHSEPRTEGTPAVSGGASQDQSCTTDARTSFDQERGYSHRVASPLTTGVPSKGIFPFSSREARILSDVG